jgi:uncharacterized membrane protein
MDVEETSKLTDAEWRFEGNIFKVVLPANSIFEVNLYAVNLELQFSEAPFLKNYLLPSIKPFKTVHLESKDQQ